MNRGNTFIKMCIKYAGWLWITVKASINVINIIVKQSQFDEDYEKNQRIKGTLDDKDPEVV